MQHAVWVVSFEPKTETCLELALSETGRTSFHKGPAAAAECYWNVTKKHTTSVRDTLTEAKANSTNQLSVGNLCSVSVSA